MSEQVAWTHQQSTWTAVLAILVLLNVIFTVVLLLTRPKPGDAPVIPGLPVIGSALALGRHGVSFISKCKQQYGNSFTLSLASIKMTFLCDPRHIEYFFSAPDDKITFRPAVEQFTQRVFGLTSRLFFPLHFKMLTELRHLLVPATIGEHLQVLGTRALQLLPCYVHHSQVDLYALCRGLVFHCAVEAVFGRAFLDALPELMRARNAGRAGGGGDRRRSFDLGGGDRPERSGENAEGEWTPYAWAAAGGGGGGGSQRPMAEGVGELAHAFFTFEEGFELAASPVPHALQPAFVGARRQLLATLGAADRRGLFAGTPAGQLLDRTTGLPAQLRPNLLLAVLWASQANTLPATFWSIAFLLLPENAAHRAVVQAELQAELKPTAASPGGGVGSTSTAELVTAASRLAGSRRSAVSRCVAEALRLRVQSIDVRQAADNLDLPLGRAARSSAKGSSSTDGGTSGGGERLLLPRGRLLAICPFVSHHDRQLFGGGGGGGSTDPWVYNPDRPEMRLGDGGAVVPSVAGLAFGGGPYRCPGRFFAEAELGLLVQLLLWIYDMNLSYTGDGQPAVIATKAGTRTADATAAAAATGLGADSTLQGGKQQQDTQQKEGPPPVGSAAAIAAARAAAAAALAAVPPQPQLSTVQGGSWWYGVLTAVVGERALAWGCGWFDGLDGPLQDYRLSGDPAGLLPPCELRRLVGIKVPRRPCWVQLAVPAAPGRRMGAAGTVAAAALGLGGASTPSRWLTRD